MVSPKALIHQVIRKLNSFRNKLNKAQNQELTEDSPWMANKLKFHIDSARAYSHFENKERAEGLAKNEKLEPLELRPNSK